MTLSSQDPQPKPGILDIAAYQPGKSGKPDALVTRVFKMSSNEQPLGASRQALLAYQRFSAHDLSRYPDGQVKNLRQALAAKFHIPETQIICGAGSDDVLQLLAHGYLSAGDEALYSQYGFLLYPIAIAATGAKAIAVPEKHFKTDIDAIIAAVTPATKMIFIANPNNPTGTYLSRGEVERLHQGLPPRVILVLDGAYAEFALNDDYENGFDRVGQFANVVITRTFSKVYGLAGLRLGWAYCPPGIADVLNRIRGPFNVSLPAQAAGIAALADEAFLAAAIDHNAHWRLWLTDEITKLGLTVTPSAANFVLVHFLSEEHAAKADDFLQRHGIYVRAVKAYGLPQCLRVSVSTAEANQAFILALGEFMRGLDV